MKTIYKTLIAAVAGIAMFAASAQAQYKPTGDDGITASPKVRDQLNARAFAVNAPLVAKTPMACAMCKDQTVTMVNRQAKGAEILAAGGVPTKTVVQHLCDGCGTEWAVTGVGKAKQSVATHTCASSGAIGLACCK